jgi:hypothetical protein
VSLRGEDWELEQGFLAGRKVTLAYCLVDPQEAPWVEHEGKSYPLHRVDPLANARAKRPARRKAAPADPNHLKPEFDPAGVLLDLASGRRPAKKEQP